MDLASFAMQEQFSRGRKHPEPAHPYRTMYQRDRERIVHCNAFRRLMGKTQVHVGQLNDHHRTRLTHSLEVAQISRTIARRLRLNEDLVEAIALSHDLGHPPFGHAGERVLDRKLRRFGGFNHNLHGLHLVEDLEERYPEFAGLNLSWEIREAFVRHAKLAENPVAVTYLESGQSLLEAQLVDAADSLAYNSHDTDDALGLGLIEFGDLEKITIWREASAPIREKFGDLKGDTFRRAVIREMIAMQVADLVNESTRRIQTSGVSTLKDIREQQTELIQFSTHQKELGFELGSFLRQQVYQHSLVISAANHGEVILEELFDFFVREPEMLPERHLQRWCDAPHSLQNNHRNPFPREHQCIKDIELIIADYLAGMTDRFAIQEHLRLYSDG
jgi:dGTPase